LSKVLFLTNQSLPVNLGHPPFPPENKIWEAGNKALVKREKEEFGNHL